MQHKPKDRLFQNSIFILIAIATATSLLIPLGAMQFTDEVNWNQKDFIVMGALLFGTASLFVLAARRTSRRRRVLLGLIFLAVFVYLWAELAVGIFTTLGS